MENLFTPLKSAMVTALCAILAFFAPIANLIFAVFIIFLLNCIAGIVADVVTDSKSFDLKKFFHCLFETMVFYVIIMAVYVIGDKLLNLAGAIQCSTVIVYAILYFYGTNILRNCAKLFPDSKTIKFMYYVLSFEIIKKIPYMDRFKEKEAEVTDDLKKEDRNDG
jgi:phage-related holin